MWLTRVGQIFFFNSRDFLKAGEIPHQVLVANLNTSTLRERFPSYNRYCVNVTFWNGLSVYKKDQFGKRSTLFVDSESDKVIKTEEVSEDVGKIDYHLCEQNPSILIKKYELKENLTSLFIKQ